MNGRTLSSFAFFFFSSSLDHTLTKAAASAATAYYLSVKPRDRNIFFCTFCCCAVIGSSIAAHQKKTHETNINGLFFRAFANTRQSSLDGLTGRGGAYSSASKPRPSSSETNLRKLAAGADGMARPGSALGLLQGNTKSER